MASKKTTNLNMNKWDEKDSLKPFRVELNDNLDKIDSTIGALSTGIADKVEKDYVDDQVKTINTELSGTVKQTVFDEEVGTLTAQLADTKNLTVQRAYARRLTPSNEIRNLVPIHMDDGYVQDYTMLLPLAIEKGFTVTVNAMALPKHQAPWLMTDAQLKELHDKYGWQINTHFTRNVDLRTLPEKEIEKEFEDTIEWFAKLGIDVTDGCCYPMGYFDEKVMRVARKYMRSGFASTLDTNKPPLRTYQLRRILLDSYTLAELKVKIDALNNEWIVLYSHTSTWDASHVQKLSDIVDYIRTKNIDIVSDKEALDVFENKLEIGDRDTFHRETFKVDALGRFHASSMGLVNLGVYTGIKNNTPITSFEKFKISVAAFLSSENSGIPIAEGAGTLLTYRLHENDALSFQEFHPYSSAETWKRTWHVANAVWNPWFKQPRIIQGQLHLTHQDLNANQTKVLTVVAPTTLSLSDNIVVNYEGGLPLGVIAQADIISPTQFNIQYSNLTPDYKIMGARYFRYAIIKA